MSGTVPESERFEEIAVSKKRDLEYNQGNNSTYQTTENV
jgi:hypothetical protein